MAEEVNGSMGSSTELYECSDGFEFVVDSDKTTEENKVFSLTWGLFWQSFMVVCFIIYIIRKRESPYLQRRNTFNLVYFIGFGCIFGISLSYRDYAGRENYPCFLVDFVTIVVLNFIVFMNVLRLFVFYHRVQFNRHLATETFYTLVSNTPILQDNLQAEKLYLSDQREYHNSSESQQNAPVRSSAYVADLSSQQQEERNALSKRLARSRFLASKTFAYLVFSVHCLITFLLGMVIQNSHKTFLCVGCVFQTDKMGYFGIYLLPAVLANFWIYKALVNEPDPLGLKKEFVLGLVPAVLFAFGGMILQTIDPNGLDANGIFFWGHIIELAIVWCFITVIPLQVKFSYQQDHVSELSKNTKGLLNFLETSSTNRELFKIHLVNELSIENYYFWKEVTDWKRNDFGGDQTAQSEKALNILDTFIKPKSVLEINISNDIYDDIQQDFNTLSPADPIPLKIFDKALQEVIRLMSIGPYDRFLNSRLYKTYENDNTVVSATSAFSTEI